MSKYLVDFRHPVRRDSESKMWMETTESWEAIVGLVALVDPYFYVAAAIVFWVFFFEFFFF